MHQFGILPYRAAQGFKALVNRDDFSKYLMQYLMTKDCRNGVKVASTTSRINKYLDS